MINLAYLRAWALTTGAIKEEAWRVVMLGKIGNNYVVYKINSGYVKIFVNTNSIVVNVVDNVNKIADAINRAKDINEFIELVAH